MYRALALLVSASIAGGCGDNLARRALGHEGLLASLREIPGVTVDEAETTEVGYQAFVLRFTQPIDHDDPGRGTFEQRVSLLHRDERAPTPMVVVTTGYADYYGGWAHELTRLLAANQISIEHRYYGTSRPTPVDWSTLTIAQMAADEHAILGALHAIYEGAFVSTGGSKGGMTAVFHRRFFPEDVAGTVPYVAPLSLGAPDERYALFLDTVGPPACRWAVRELATELLANRRAAMLSRAAAQPGHSYARVPLGAALEAAIVGLEWSFWQYQGVDACASLPPTNASDDALFAFLDRVAPVSGSDDTSVAAFEAYFVQSAAQLGYPDSGAAYLDEHRWYSDEDYAARLPTSVPRYDVAAMRDIDQYVHERGSHLVFVYGEWDPWTAGRFTLGAATDAISLDVPRGTHGARLAALPAEDRDLAFARIEAWTGVEPQLPRLTAAAAPSAEVAIAKRPPPALVRALRARK